MNICDIVIHLFLGLLGIALAFIGLSIIDLGLMREDEEHDRMEARMGVES